MNNNNRLPISSSSPPASDGDGNHMHNEILLDLPAAEFALVISVV